MRKGFLLSALLTSMMVWGSVRANGPEDDLIEYDDCAASNWYVGFEAAILKPHVGSYTSNNVSDPTFDYQLSPRVWLGWENSEGVGVRARYWQIDTDAVATNLNDSVYSRIKADTLDVEATLRGCLGRIDMLLSGGFRYAKLEMGYTSTGGNYYDRYETDVEGCGLTLALEAIRPIGNRGFALVGGFRQSWIYGYADWRNEWDYGGNPGLDEYRFKDSVLQISEAKAGMQWSHCLATGATLTAAALWEVQAWEPNDSLFNGEGDIGFSGPTLSIALLR